MLTRLAGGTDAGAEPDDGRPADATGLVVHPTSGLWGVPVTLGDVPDLVRYTDAGNLQISALRVES